jgi:thiamine-monophosphate kinase
MDISDGLVQDLGQIARASGLAARIEEAHLPLSQELRRAFPDQAAELALTGGEDYQLLLCGPRPALERLIVEGLDLTIVGEMVEGPPAVSVLGPNGVVLAYPAGGWDHFRGGNT